MEPGSVAVGLPLTAYCSPPPAHHSLFTHPHFSHFLDEGGNELLIIAHHAEAGVLENRRLRIGVDGDDRLGAAAARQVMPRAGDADRDIELRLHRLAGEP